MDTKLRATDLVASINTFAESIRGDRINGEDITEPGMPPQSVYRIDYCSRPVGIIREIRDNQGQLRYQVIAMMGSQLMPVSDGFTDHVDAVRALVCSHRLLNAPLVC